MNATTQVHARLNPNLTRLQTQPGVTSRVLLKLLAIKVPRLRTLHTGVPVSIDLAKRVLGSLTRLHPKISPCAFLQPPTAPSRSSSWIRATSTTSRRLRIHLSCTMPSRVSRSREISRRRGQSLAAVPGNVLQESDEARVPRGAKPFFNVRPVLGGPWLVLGAPESGRVLLSPTARSRR